MIVKPTDSTVVVPEEVVMQPRLTVGVLILQAEGLVCAICYLGFFFQTAPAGVVTKPDYLRYWSSLSGCRFGRSGSSGSVVRFRRLRWSSYVPVPRVRLYLTCPTSGLEVSCGLQLALIIKLESFC